MQQLRLFSSGSVRVMGLDRVTALMEPRVTSLLATFFWMAGGGPRRSRRKEKKKRKEKSKINQRVNSKGWKWRGAVRCGAVRLDHL